MTKQALSRRTALERREAASSVAPVLHPVRALPASWPRTAQSVPTTRPISPNPPRPTSQWLGDENPAAMEGRRKTTIADSEWTPLAKLGAVNGVRNVEVKRLEARPSLVGANELAVGGQISVCREPVDHPSSRRSASSML